MTTASRRDLYAGLGWVTCGTCGGAGTNQQVYDKFQPFTSCPAICFAGLVPPDVEIEAARNVIYPGMSGTSIRWKETEAALVAAARSGDALEET